MKDPIITFVLLTLLIVGWRLLPSIFGVRKELRDEKESAERYAAMTPEEILAKEKVDIKQKVNILHILGFILSFAIPVPCLILGSYIVDKFQLEETVWETVIIVLSIAVGFCLMLAGAIKFVKAASAMQIKELRSMGRTKHYYLYTFLKSLLVVVGVAGIILLLWYFGII